MTPAAEPPLAGAATPAPGPDLDPTLPISVVVPVRNAEHIVDSCLRSIAAQRPAEIIVVDGCSTDRTVTIASRLATLVLSDGGAGVAAARRLGASVATSRYVALVDADVVLPAGSLARLFDEYVRDGYVALQAGLESTSGDGYWGRALAAHHRTGRSRWWFGLVATIFERDTFLAIGLDEGFRSGEDVELRLRLEQAGARIGVSRRTLVEHRFDDTWTFALGQWLADGAGLAGTVAKHGLRAAWLVVLPIAAAGRGMVLSLVRREPQWLPYYACYALFNYVGFARGVRAQWPGRVR